MLSEIKHVSCAFARCTFRHDALENVPMHPLQCLKLRVHPAPGVHILTAGCTGFDTCAPGVCMGFQILNRLI